MIASALADRTSVLSVAVSSTSLMDSDRTDPPDPPGGDHTLVGSGHLHPPDLERQRRRLLAEVVPWGRR
jgi:hypothetical protein